MNRDLDPEKELHHMRAHYTRSQLDEDHLAGDAMTQFRTWFEDIRKSEVEAEPNAMTLATVDPAGMPNARTVLLKGGLDQDAFWFYTNYTSQKGRELDATPRASLVFLWKIWERQVCVRGTVRRLSPAENESYFNSRPYESQIGAWVSRQSQAIPDRSWLEDRNRAFREKYPENQVPCPDFWGGFTLEPLVMEFWQGRPGRLHDRFRYQRENVRSPWAWERVCP